MHMKHFVLFIFVCFFMTTVSAQETSVNLGLKAWYASASLEYSDNSGASLKEESEWTLLYGPSLNIRRGDYFIGASYLTGSFPFNDFDNTGVDIDMDRNELDFVAGYYFVEKLAAIIGYKSIDYKIQGTDIKADAKGPAIAITGYYPFAEKYIIFGTISYVDLNGDNIDDAEVVAVEFGVARPLSNPAFSVSAGVKSQVYDYKESFYEETDTFTGLMFGINYSI